jgi:hypothetical protein
MHACAAIMNSDMHAKGGVGGFITAVFEDLSQLSIALGPYLSWLTPG